MKVPQLWVTNKWLIFTALLLNRISADHTMYTSDVHAIRLTVLSCRVRLLARCDRCQGRWYIISNNANKWSQIWTKTRSSDSADVTMIAAPEAGSKVHQTEKILGIDLEFRYRYCNEWNIKNGTVIAQTVQWQDNGLNVPGDRYRQTQKKNSRSFKTPRLAPEPTQPPSNTYRR